MEANAVGVNRRAARPVGQAAVDAIERFEATLSRAFLNDGEEVSRVKPPFAGDRTLLVRRQTFDLPLRQKDVRERNRRAAEDPSNDPRPAFRAIEVDDVRELVREDQTQPVIEIRAGSRRRHGVQDHGVVRHRRGVAIEQLGLVRQHHPRPARRGQTERLFEQPATSLRRCAPGAERADLLPDENRERNVRSRADGSAAGDRTPARTPNSPRTRRRLRPRRARR